MRVSETKDAPAAPPPVRKPLREIKPGARIEWALRVMACEVKTIKKGGRAGEKFHALKLGDVTGALPGNDWRPPSDEVAVGTILWVEATYVDDPKWGRQLDIEKTRIAKEGEYDVDDLVEPPPVSLEELEAERDEIIAWIKDPFLRIVVNGLIGPEGSMTAAFREAPAAKLYHEARRHGLLEHSLRVARKAKALAEGEPQDVVDLAIAGALLHDIGKIEAYEMKGEAVEVTDNETLIGHISEGHHVVRRAMELELGENVRLPELGRRLEHVVLSHHGKLEHGSPVVPATREAVIVHDADSNAARLGSYDRVEKEMPPGVRCSEFDRGAGGRVYVPLRREE